MDASNMPHPLAQRMWQERAELLASMRPPTMVYAFAWTLIGFCFVSPTPWLVRLTSATTFGLLTGSIMVFNDIIDALPDSEPPKCKTYARDHPSEMWGLFTLMSGVIALLLIAVIVMHARLGIFCTAVYLAGLGYSYIPRVLIVNNVVVALCSASPVLCGVVTHWSKALIPIQSFVILVATIMISEIIKDMEDIDVDLGHKATIPLSTANSGVTMASVYFGELDPLVPRILREQAEYLFPPIDPRLHESFRLIRPIVYFCQAFALVVFQGYGFWYIVPITATATLLFWSLTVPSIRITHVNTAMNVAIMGLTITVLQSIP